MTLPRIPRIPHRFWRGAVVFLLAVGINSPVEAQLGGLKKKIAQAALCGGGAYLGLKLGEKLAQVQIARSGATGQKAEEIRRGYKIGAAVALCATGAVLAGTVYDKLSENDRKARDDEIAAALAETEPGTRTYVLPESQYEGTLTTDVQVIEDQKECRTVVDHLADTAGGEPAIIKYCRTPPDGKYEPVVF